MNYDVQLPPFRIECEVVAYGARTRPFSWGVDFLKANEVRPDGSGVIVFVIDTEDGASHPAVKDATLHEYCQRFTNEAPEVETAHGHGLHVADTILQVAPGVKIVFLKALNNVGLGTSLWIGNAIRYAADLVLTGAYIGHKKIINLSLGSNTPSPIIKAAIEHATSKNVEVFAAAGNDGREVDFPAAFGHLVISVAAINDQAEPAEFSSIGPENDLAAPGVGIQAAYKTGYVALSGTSTAVPHAVGIAARILSHRQKVNLESFMNEFATDIDEPGKDNKTGYGVPYATNYFKEDIEPPPAQDPEPPAKKRRWRWIAAGAVMIAAVLYFILR